MTTSDFLSFDLLGQQINAKQKAIAAKVEVIKSLQATTRGRFAKILQQLDNLNPQPSQLPSPLSSPTNPIENLTPQQQTIPTNHAVHPSIIPSNKTPTLLLQANYYLAAQLPLPPPSPHKYHHVSTASDFLELERSSPKAIEDITVRMGAGVAKAICKEVETTDGNTKFNSPSDLLLEHDREQSVLHQEVSPKLTPYLSFTLRLEAVCHLIVSALACWPVYGWTLGLVHFLFDRLYATTISVLCSKEGDLSIHFTSFSTPRGDCESIFFNLSFDEFAKRDINDLITMHEVENQQSVSLTKAEIKSTWNARKYILILVQAGLKPPWPPPRQVHYK